MARPLLKEPFLPLLFAGGGGGGRRGWVVLAAVAVLLLALSMQACAVSGGRSADGGQWFFASILENTAEEARSVDERGFIEAKIAKDQTTGAQTIARAVLAREAIREASAALRAHVARNQAVETATIRSGSDLDILRETNRSAESMQALELITTP